MLEDAEKEIAKSKEIWNSPNVKSLREQQEKDFGLWGPYEFKMPKEEGKWSEVTTNSSKILANKIIGLLAASTLQLYIDVENENRKARKTLVSTEQLANGAIWLADRAAISVSLGKKLQSSLASYATLRGGTIKTVYWWVNEDSKPVCDIKSYDPTYCEWLEGEDVFWFCNHQYVSKRWVERTFKGFNYGTTNNLGQLLMYTFWDEDEYKVAINGKYVESAGEEHGLGYVPVNIRSCGAVPYLQSEEYTDTMKWSWQSCFANHRDIPELESKLYSIELSKAIESGRIKIAGEWDSQASGNQPPEGLEKLGYGSKTRNEVILFDTSKGQKFGGMIQPPDNQIADRLLNRLMAMNRPIDPIAFGQMTRSGSGALAAELRAAALEFIIPFRECVEEDFIWIAWEVVRQFKEGQYEKVTVEGRDRKKQKFYLNVMPKDVEVKHFDCELVADRLRDEIQELGAAIQKVQYGLSSRRTAMVKHNIVEDPDRELDIMDEETASQDPVLKYDKLAKYFKDQGDERMALYYQALSEITIEKTVQQAVMQQLMPAQGKPPVASPQMETGNIAAQPREGMV